MRGTYRGAEERSQIREQWAQNVVPKLATREIEPLLGFLGDRTGLTVLDIGANKGLWTRALLNVFGDRVARVHLFDPSPENYRELTNEDDSLAGFTASEFRRLVVHACGLGAAPGTATLYTNEDGSPLSSLYPHEEPGWGERMKHIRLSHRVEVRIDTVDRALSASGIESVDLMKIDTEGHEMDVLLGAEHALRARKVDLITFEFGVHQVESRHFFKDYWLHLTERGYHLFFIDDAGTVTPLERYEYRWEQFNRNWEFVASRIPVRNGASPGG
jgi:FkbM family methyltransferase